MVDYGILDLGFMELAFPQKIPFLVWAMLGLAMLMTFIAGFARGAITLCAIMVSCILVPAVIAVSIKAAAQTPPSLFVYAIWIVLVLIVFGISRFLSIKTETMIG